MTGVSVLMVAVGEPPKVGRAAVVVANNLRVDSGTAEVLRALEAVRAQTLLLKGPSVVRWLYDADDPRIYIDGDLLVRPADLATVENVLANRGFVPNVYEREMPAWWREHAVGWQRPDDGAIVDLHRTLPGVGVDPQRVWLTLSAAVEGIEVAGFTATTLTLPGRALHLALHAAQHGVGWPEVTAELDRALARTDQAVWRAALKLARALEAIPAFATGLRLTARGRGLASQLELPRNRPVDVALRAGIPPPVALGLDRLARAENWRARLSIMRHKVVPPATFVRAWSPLARRGPLGLALAYAWRPLWLLWHAPAGFRAWRGARSPAASNVAVRPATHNLPNGAPGRRESLGSWARLQRARLMIAWMSSQRRVAVLSERLANRLFDQGLDTRGDAYEPEHHHSERKRYVPSDWHLLPRALRYIGVSDRDTFVDFGCGKGRILHQAAKRPFRRVIGVEISPALAEIARRGLASRKNRHRCRYVEVVVCDAREFPVPDDLTVGYFWYPFGGETFDRVLRGIIESIDRHPRRVRLIYVGPDGAEILATGRFRLLKRLASVPDTTGYRAPTIFESY